LPEDAIYPTAKTDGDGKPLDGANKYELHFAKNEIPPAGAFWSLTMYDADKTWPTWPLTRQAGTA
jgi:hypothetical protein